MSTFFGNPKSPAPSTSSGLGSDVRDAPPAQYLPFEDVRPQLHSTRSTSHGWFVHPASCILSRLWRDPAAAGHRISGTPYRICHQSGGREALPYILGRFKADAFLPIPLSAEPAQGSAEQSQEDDRLEELEARLCYGSGRCLVIAEGEYECTRVSM